MEARDESIKAGGVHMVDGWVRLPGGLEVRADAVTASRVRDDGRFLEVWAGGSVHTVVCTDHTAALRAQEMLKRGGVQW